MDTYKHFFSWNVFLMQWNKRGKEEEEEIQKR